MQLKSILYLGLASLLGCVGISSALHFQQLEVNPLFISLLRWVFILPIIYYAFLKKSMTTWILVSMVIGILVGLDFPVFSKELKLISQIFLRLIKCVIAPLIFGTLVVGIAGHGDMKQVGRMGWKSILYFEIVTTLALFIGLFAINVSKAGVGVHFQPTAEKDALPVTHQTFSEIILHTFPENIAKSVSEGAVLQVVVFSILFGIGLSLTDHKHKQTMLSFCESLSEVMFKFTHLIMKMAPLAVGAAIAYTVGHMGISILLNLVKLLLTLYAALFGFVLLVLVPIALIFKINILKLAKLIAEPVSLAFATTSSEAALPKAMDAMEKFGVPRKIISFVMPLGYSFNLDGTTLYLALASVFVAQAAGVELSISAQITMMLTLMLTSKGVAGVPRASLVILLGTLASFNLPVEPVFIILGIDELMDMARTAVNVIGNCLATAVIARSEGELMEN